MLCLQADSSLGLVVEASSKATHVKVDARRFSTHRLTQGYDGSTGTAGCCTVELGRAVSHLLPRQNARARHPLVVGGAQAMDVGGAMWGSITQLGAIGVHVVQLPLAGMLGVASFRKKDVTLTGRSSSISHRT